LPEIKLFIFATGTNLHSFAINASKTRYYSNPAN